MFETHLISPDKFEQKVGRGKVLVKVEKLLNNRPRKCLNYQTPYEVFRKACGALAA